MDIRVGKIATIRVLPRPVDLPWVHHSIAQVEEATARVIEKLRPKLEWIYGFRRRFATLTVFVLTGWLLVHVMFGANGMMVYRQKHEQVLSLQREINSLQQENDGYGKQIEDLKTDPKTIEKTAREQLHYVRPGEVVYISPVAGTQDAPHTDSARK